MSTFSYVIMIYDKYLQDGAKFVSTKTSRIGIECPKCLVWLMMMIAGVGGTTL